MGIRRYAGSSCFIASLWLVGPGLCPVAAQLLGPEFQVNTYTASRQSRPSVAADGPGNFVVVWHSLVQDGSYWGVFGQRFSPAGAPVGSEFQVNTYTTSPQANPAVAADGSGNFVVAWQSYGQDGAGWGVFGQRFSSAGSRVGPEFQVNSYTTAGQYSPAVAADGAGKFVVVWQSPQDGSDDGVFGQRFGSTGSPVGSEFQINSYTTSWQMDPAVATDASGNFVVAWQSFFQDGSEVGVFGQRFNSAGSPAGSELQVNTYTTGFQYEPAVAADGSGSLVVVWNSLHQDGSDNGVFAQRLRTFPKIFGHGFEANPPFWSDTTATMCSGLCFPGGTPDGICHCDSICISFQDCCLDACVTCGVCLP